MDQVSKRLGAFVQEFERLQSERWESMSWNRKFELRAFLMLRRSEWTLHWPALFYSCLWTLETIIFALALDECGRLSITAKYGTSEDWISIVADAWKSGHTG